MTTACLVMPAAPLHGAVEWSVSIQVPRAKRLPLATFCRAAGAG